MMRGLRKKSAYGLLTGRDGAGRKSDGKSRGAFHLRGEDALRVGLMVLVVGLLTLLFPTRQSPEYSSYREGMIAPEEVIAPETFYVTKSDAEYNREVAAARGQVPPVLVFKSSLSAEQKQALNAFFDDLIATSKTAAPDTVRVQRLKASHPEIGPVSESTLRFLLAQAAHNPERLDRLRRTARDLLTSIYDTGVIAEKDTVLDEEQREVALVRNGRERRVPAREIQDLGDVTVNLQEDIRARLPAGSPQEIKTVYELVAAYLTPNLTYDSQETERRRDEAAHSVSRIKGTVLKGERIIDAHDRISQDDIDKLRSLAAHMNDQSQEAPYLLFVQIAARAILSGLMIAILFSFLKAYKPSIYRRTSNIALFGILVLMPAMVAWYAATRAAVTPFLVPVALSVMLITVLFDGEVGLVLALVTATLCGIILSSLQHGIIFLITGVVGAYSVRNVHHRSDFYRSIAYLASAYLLATIATGVLLFSYSNLGEFFQKIRWDLVFGVFTACASSVLTIGLLPIFESVFDVVTPITLLELSDLNRPLLRNLAIRAPGTYSHSIIMANLSEAAADAIHADPLLVRVGCYYHDIGKMIRPHYFIENQKGVNPHDELQPRMSALILISHVKEGVELAEEEGLPQTIVDLIPQHHGTSEIASFKHRALERGDKQTVRDEDFRYPGPKPQTKEAGIINLADAVESATRTLSSNSPDQIKGMVQTIVKGRFTAGELDECDLTLRDLTKIQEAFLPILQATRHSRVAYPWQIQQEQRRERRKERS